MADRKNKSADGCIPVYRCELCSGVTFKTDSKVGPGVLHTLITNGPTVIEAQGVPRDVIHGCSNGGFGIARIVGIVPERVMTMAMTPIFEDDHECKGPVN